MDLVDLVDLVVEGLVVLIFVFGLVVRMVDLDVPVLVLLTVFVGELDLTVELLLVLEEFDNLLVELFRLDMAELLLLFRVKLSLYNKEPLLELL